MKDDDGYNVMAALWLGFVLALVCVLAGCGGGADEPEACPVVTAENVHLMTGNVPPGSACAQVPIRETVTFCSMPLDQAGPPEPCDWKGPT